MEKTIEERKETTEIGCYNLAGAIIRQALFDYQFFKKRLEDPWYTGRRPCRQARRKNQMNQIRFYFESAEDYLFSKNKLETWLEQTGLDRVISIGYIRHVAKNGDILGQKKLSETNFREMSTIDEQSEINDDQTVLAEY